MREERPDLGVPLLEEVRDGRTQAVHSGDAVLLDADGHIDHQWGHGDQGAYWRSAAKPLQALAFVETGAFDALRAAGLDERHLAIACSSHNGEPMHVEAARELLAAAGLQESDLGCGAHEPMGGVALGGPMPKGGWSAIHNNCSGKHAAMLATAKHNGWPTQGYLDPEHPLQLAIRATIGEATGEPVAWGTDGCSAPCFWSSIKGMARAFQWLDRRPAGRRILDAMAANPHSIAGTGMWDTAFIGAGKGRWVGKVGAAGLYVAVNRTNHEAFACKVGSGSRDARDWTAAHLAKDAGWLDAEAKAALRPFLAPSIATWNGKVVGTTRSFV
ncbi:MAG TPA: asparaginase [Candidatus Thermoplasmatota archaeon]|nr:asparaginase [Candidatus Thermoplasmatota archaeon]